MGEESTIDKKYKRNYKACLNCRVRKVKCDLGSLENPVDGKCARCKRERKDCIFVESKRGGHSNIVNGRNKKQLETVNQTTSFPSGAEPPFEGSSKSFAEPDPKPRSSNTFSTMEGALVYLARAAGSIAKPDQRDHIDAGERHQQLEQTTKESRKIPKHIQDHTNYLSVPITHEFSIRPPKSSRLSNIDYIGESGLLTELEAELLINLFFTTMYPYFPHIPNFLHEPQVLAGYPLLLCAILTIATRYHSLDDQPNNITTGNVEGVPRNIEIHDKLWLYVQKLISQTVWAEASTRSIGTIFAFLLLTEWNPRAIHWRWSDYANVPDDSKSLPPTDGDLAGLGAVRRSYRMAWMLIGSAVRLSQDMGFMDISPKTFLATHISEINSVMNMNRRSMLSQSLSEVELDDTDVVGDENYDDDSKLLDMNEDDITQCTLNHPLKFNEHQRAKIELLQIMSLSHESLYGHKAQLGNLSPRQNLAILNIISPLLINWGKKYNHLMKQSVAKNYNHANSNALLDQNSKLAKDLGKCIEYENFIFEFNYAKLYVYSLALSSKSEPKTPKKHRANLKLDEVSKSAKYIEHAFSAANEMLVVAHRVHKLKLLRFMPVRWATRIVRAVAFIVKCYLTITAHKKLSQSQQASNTFEDYDATVLSLSLIPVNEIVSSIQKTAITLRDCSPDELHLCTRYSNVLMYLCSEMKANSKSINDAMDFDLKPYSYNMGDDDNTNDVLNHSHNDANDKTSGISTPLQNIMGDSEVMEWFMTNKNVGLDFVVPWTEMIEQQLNSNVQFDYHSD